MDAIELLIRSVDNAIAPKHRSDAEIVVGVYTDLSTVHRMQARLIARNPSWRNSLTVIESRKRFALVFTAGNIPPNMPRTQRTQRTQPIHHAQPRNNRWN